RMRPDVLDVGAGRAGSAAPRQRAAVDVNVVPKQLRPDALIEDRLRHARTFPRNLIMTLNASTNRDVAFEHPPLEGGWIALAAAAAELTSAEHAVDPAGCGIEQIGQHLRILAARS